MYTGAALDKLGCVVIYILSVFMDLEFVLVDKACQGQLRRKSQSENIPDNQG